MSMNTRQLEHICQFGPHYSAQCLKEDTEQRMLYEIPFWIGRETSVPVLEMLPPIGARFGSWSIDEDYIGGAPEVFDIVRQQILIESTKSCGETIHIYMIIFDHYNMEYSYADHDYIFVGVSEESSKLLSPKDLQKYIT